MSNNSFTFQKFTIHQDRCAMKVGTDGVLLGAWAHGGKRILDIGTGTGLVAIMMAQRFADAHVTAVEIDHNAALQACNNANCSPFASRIGIVETSIQNFEVYGTQLFDSIVSNPPFFTYAYNVGRCFGLDISRCRYPTLSRPIYSRKKIAC